MTALASRTRTQRLALAAALFTVVAWASAFVGIRSAGEHLSPGPLSLLRVAVAAVALGTVVLVRREPLPARGDLPRLIVVGTLWFAGYNLALNAGEQRIDAGTAAMLVNVAPILIAVLAGLVLGEGFPRALWAGLAIAFCGVSLIAAATSDGLTLSVGALLCLAAAVVYAVSVIVQKPLLGHLSALSVTWGACTIGLLVCLPFAGTLAAELGEASAGSIAWAVYLGLVPTALAFTTWAYALARTSAGRLGVTTYLIPPIAIVLGWAFLGEIPPALAFVGGAIALVGVVMSRRG